MDFPDGSVVKNLPANVGDAGDIGWIPWSGRSSGEGNGNPLHYSCLGNFMDRGAWLAIVHWVTKSLTRLSVHACTYVSVYIHTYMHACMCAQSFQLCLTLCHPMDCSLPGSSVYGIVQARILEQVAKLSSRASSRPRDQLNRKLTRKHKL